MVTKETELYFTVFLFLFFPPPQNLSPSERCGDATHFLSALPLLERVILVSRRIYMKTCNLA